MQDLFPEAVGQLRVASISTQWPLGIPVLALPSPVGTASNRSRSPLSHHVLKSN